MVVVRCSLFVVRCSLFVVRCSLLVVGCSLFVVRCSLAAGCLSLEVSDVHVDNRQHRAAGVQDDGDAGGKKIRGGELECLRNFFRQLPMHRAEIHTAFFNHPPLDDAAAATATARPLPGVLLKFSAAVHLLQGMANAVLKALKPSGYFFFLNHFKQTLNHLSMRPLTTHAKSGFDMTSEW